MPRAGRCDGMYGQTPRCSNCSFRPTTDLEAGCPPEGLWRLTVMKPVTAETPIARRFAAALAEADPVRIRIGIEMYTAAFLVAEPVLITSPKRRARIAAAIEEL